MPGLKEPVERFLSDINQAEAQAGNLASMFVDPDKYPLVQDAKDVSLCTPSCVSVVQRFLYSISPSPPTR